jgi:hypothetical protein
MHLSLKGSLDRQPLTDRLGDRLLAEYGGAAAAYSLRALNGNGDSVVRVRRASDNDEEDFTAEQIELGEMVNWVNSQTVPPLDIGVETSGGRIPVPEGGTSIGIPAAAYSLRNLSTTYTGNVVDVRRSSGGTESFTAAEVSDGTLTDWVLAPVSSFIGNKMYFDRVNDYINLDSFISYTGDFTLTFSFIPDTLDGTIQPVVGNGNIDYIGVAQINGSDRIYVSTLAGSTQFIVLDSNFTEKAVNDVIISRSGSTITFTVNGDVQSTTLTYSTTIPISRIGARGIGVALLKGIITELDFGNGTTFDGTIADGNTIGTVNGSPELFTGQGFDGFVTKWYDQSGNDNHATQGTDAKQPKIVDGGVLVRGNTGEPAFTGDGVDDILSLSSSINFGTGEFFVSTVVDVDTGGVVIGSASPNWMLLVTTSSIQVRASNTNVIYIISPDSVLTAGESYLISLSRVGNDITAYVNGVAQADVETVVSTDTFSADRFLQRGTNGNPYPDPVSEVIIYNSDQSDNRTAIEANIGETYGITGIPAYDNTVDGFVETWYDQSGNGNDATQSVAASQPKIVDAGSLVSGGLEFDGVNDGLQWGTAPITSTDSASSFIVCTSGTTAGARTAMALSDNTPNVNRWYSPWMASSAFYLAYGDSVTKISLGAADTSKHLWSTTAGLTTTEAFKDGVTGGTTASVSGISPLISDNIGAANGGSRWDGTINEIIIYDSDQSASRVGIEANINDHYNIY